MTVTYTPKPVENRDSVATHPANSYGADSVVGKFLECLAQKCRRGYTGSIAIEVKIDDGIIRNADLTSREHIKPGGR